MFTRIDHVGIAVEDLEKALELWGERLEMTLSHREVVSEQGVEAALLDVGEGHVELLSPLGPDTPVGKFLAMRGPGLHHVAYAVSDIDWTLSSLSAAGVPLIDEKPRIGIRESKVAFLHPKGTGGVLTEIVEPKHGPASGGAAIGTREGGGEPASGTGGGSVATGGIA